MQTTLASPTAVMVMVEGVVVGEMMVQVLGAVEVGPFQVLFPASFLSSNQLEMQVVAKMEQ